MSRIMALDVGDKRIGVALSDPLGITAQGLKVMENSPVVLDDIANLCQEYDVHLIVVGLPRNMNNTLGPRAEICQDFARKVAVVTGLQVELEDERLTTAAVNRMLIDADLSRGKRRKVVDKMAAVLILQNFLAKR